MNGRTNRMPAVAGAGLALTLFGLAGYVVGIVAAYPGRAFSVTAVMVGITLLAVGNALRKGGTT